MLPSAPALRRIAPRVVQVRLRGTSAFLLLDERLTLIDTGWRGSGARLLRALRACGRSPDEVERIIITHYHPDHVGGLFELQQELPARTAIHALEAPAVSALPGPPPPFASPWLRTLSRPLLRRLMPFRPVRIDEVLHDGDELPMLGGVRVVHTPGHTPGHIALYLPELRLLIAGDALQRRRGSLTGPAAAVTADMAEAKRSIGRLAGLQVETLAFSHFPQVPARAAEQVQRLAGRWVG